MRSLENAGCFVRSGIRDVGDERDARVATATTVFEFSSYPVVVVVVGRKSGKAMGNRWWSGLAVAVRVLENVGVGKRKTRKAGTGGEEEAQVVHGINRRSVKGCGNGCGVSGKGGLGQEGRGCGRDPGCTGAAERFIRWDEKRGRAWGRGKVVEKPGRRDQPSAEV